MFKKVIALTAALFFSLSVFAVPQTYKKSTIGFEISNPLNLEWYSAEVREMASAEAKKSSPDAPGMLLAMSYVDGPATGGFAVNYRDEFNKSKPLRYLMGTVVNVLEKRFPEGTNFIGDYENIDIGGRPGIYYKIDANYDAVPDDIKPLHQDVGHIWAAIHEDNLFFFQSGVRVSLEVKEAERLQLLEKFESAMKSTMETVKFY